MKKTLIAGFAALGMLANTMSCALAEWKPNGPIKFMIAFAAGGGADTQARLIGEHLEKTRGWKIIPENVTGKGGLNLLKAMKGQPNDGSVIGMVVTETLGYNLAANKKSGLSLGDFTPITTTAGFQMGIVAKSDTGWKTFADVVGAAKGGQKIRFGAMSPKLADLTYMLGKKHGIEFNTVMLRGGKAVMNAVNAGDVDIGWAAGIQNKAVKAGDVVNLASGLSTRLKISPDAPTLAELGVPFNADGYFLVVAPAGVPADARAALADAISGAAADPATKVGGLINKAFGGASIIKGDELDALMASGSSDSEALMKASAE